MKPSLKDIRFDPILSNISVAYQNADYVANLVSPVLPSKTRTGKYFIFDKSKFRKVKSLRGMGSFSNEVGYGVSQSEAYVCEDHALVQLVPDELKDQAPTPLSPEMDAVENVRERLLIEREYDLSVFMTSTTNLPRNTTLSSTDQWSDPAGSDPIDDIETGIESVRSRIFKRPNVLLLGQQTYNKLKHHPDILDRLKYSSFGKVTPDILATLFDVDKVIVAAAGYETATEGQTSSIDYIWGKHAWLLFVNKASKVNNVSFSYFFQYKPTLSVDKWYDKGREGTFVRIHDYFTRKTVSADAAYLIKNAVA